MRPLLLPLSLLLAGCATVIAGDGPVALEQRARVGPLRVTPLAVVEDSRCPDNARCIWAGRVVVRVLISGGGSGPLTRDLTLGIPTAAGTRRVLLDGVTPGRTAGTIVPPAAWRFHFATAD